MKMGNIIKYKKAYHRKCSKRFQFDKQYLNILSPLLSKGKGMIIGTRDVIMENHKIHSNNNYDGQNYATGNYESVFLVVESARQNPVIVRKIDVIS